MPPDKRKRPVSVVADEARNRSAAGDRFNHTVVDDSVETDRRRRWSAAMIRAAVGPIPRFGSRSWWNLPATSSTRVAAVVLAAECWAEDGDDVARRLAREITDGRAAVEQIEAEDHAAMASNVRKMASRPTFAELADRRGQPERAERARRRAVEIRDGWNAPGGAA